METCNFWIVIMEYLPFFQNFLKFYRIFGENLEKNFENLEIYIGRGFGGRAPRSHRIYGNLSSKINGNLQFLYCSKWIFDIFQFLKEFYRIFRGNCANNLGKYGLMYLYSVRGRSPPSVENFKKSYSKILWKSAIFWKFSWILTEVFI